MEISVESEKLYPGRGLEPGTLALRANAFTNWAIQDKYGSTIELIFIFRKRDYLKGKLTEVETNSKQRNIRGLYKGIKDFKKGYHASVNVIKNESKKYAGAYLRGWTNGTEPPPKGKKN